VFEPHYYDRNQEVYAGLNEQAENPALSSDGEWMAHNYRGFCNAIGFGTVTPGDLCIVNLATGKSKCVNTYLREPDFSPVGGWLVFTAEYTGQHEVWKAQLLADGSLVGLTQLTRGPAGQPSSEPNWSSDGNWIVFKRDVDTSAGVNWQLHIVRADGAGVRNLSLAGEEPAWFGGGDAPSSPNVQPRSFLPMVTR
jgi:Tol biopolymer transport system component